MSFHRKLDTKMWYTETMEFYRRGNKYTNATHINWVDLRSVWKIASHESHTVRYLCTVQKQGKKAVYPHTYYHRCRSLNNKKHTNKVMVNPKFRWWLPWMGVGWAGRNATGTRHPGNWMTLRMFYPSSWVVSHRYLFYYCTLHLRYVTHILFMTQIYSNFKISTTA